jgi:hypothetical protein
MFKQAVILGCVVMLLAACRQSGNDVARDLVMHYCDIHYRHYQPFEFEKAQQYYVPYERSKQFTNYTAQQKLLKQQKDSLKRLITIANKPSYLLQANIIDSALNSVDTAMAQNKQSYKPEHLGWMVVHSYNQQPVGGAMTRTTSVFIIDTDLKHVIETYDK